MLICLCLWILASLRILRYDLRRQTPHFCGGSVTLDPDENGEAVDQREYMSMIDSLFYLMVIRPDIQFTVCLSMRF
jgi:hypothetical protein